MEKNFYDLVVWAYNFLDTTQFTAFGVTLSLLDVFIGMFLLGLIWYAIDRIFD